MAVDMKSIAHGLLALAATLALPAVAPASAEALRDPTRPAFDVEATGVGAGNAAGGGAAAGDAAAGPAAPARQGPQLQSIVHRSQGRSLAVIDGRTLRPGDRFGNARVAAIGEHSVTLAGPDGRRVLSLTPAARKTYRRTAAAGAASGKDRLPPAAQQGRKQP